MTSEKFQAPTNTVGAVGARLTSRFGRFAALLTNILQMSWPIAVSVGASPADAGSIRCAPAGRALPKPRDESAGPAARGVRPAYCRPPATAPSWKIGRNMAMTMLPTMTPRKTMSRGSMRDVSAATIASHSVS